MNREPIELPKWAWSVMGATGGLSLVLLASFFSWLGITVVTHGQNLKVTGTKLDHIETAVDRIDLKLQPTQEMQTTIKHLQDDAMNREQQLDSLERRVDVLERGK